MTIEEILVVIAIVAGAAWYFSRRLRSGADDAPYQNIIRSSFSFTGSWRLRSPIFYCAAP